MACSGLVDGAAPGSQALVIPVMVVLALVVPTPDGVAEPKPRREHVRAVETSIQSDGVVISASETERVSAPSSTRRTPRQAARQFQTRYVVACDGNSVWSGDEVPTCGFAVAACGGEPGRGPLVQVWRREVTPSVSGWRWVASTCIGPGVPRQARPGVDVEVVRTAFARLPLKRPVVAMQPPGGRTLVRVPVFVEATFPGAGVGPGQVHAVRLLGRSVRFRVVARGYAWTFGDGSVLQTVSAGGSWPDGDVQHVYPAEGVFDVRVAVRYGAEFSVEGGGWLPVGATVTLASVPARMQVCTAQARLVPS